jgi:cardiolipin synthase
MTGKGLRSRIPVSIHAGNPGLPETIFFPESPELLTPCSREISRYVMRFDRFQLARGARLLVNGDQTFPEMLRAIEAARNTVDLETYILCADRTGELFQKALIQAARRGVRVRLLYDYIGSLGLPHSFLQEMIDAQVEVRVYHPVVLKTPLWKINHRDHRKILVTDGRWSFTGGLNIADDYASSWSGGGGWRDTHVVIEGEEVAEWVERLFEYGWRNAAPYQQTSTRRQRLRAQIRRHFRKPITLKTLMAPRQGITPDLCSPDRVAVRILSNKEFRFRFRIREAYLYAIEKAQRYILVENAYFIPDPRIRKALERAVQRGVFVGVVVAREYDVPIAAHAGRYLFRGLLEAGIHIFQWPLAMMHAKTAVIDDAWSVVGSYNFDHRSLLHQLECVAVIADPKFAGSLREQTLADIAQSEELTIEKHHQRPWQWKIMEPLAYLIRYWL